MKSKGWAVSRTPISPSNLPCSTSWSSTAMDSHPLGKGCAAHWYQDSTGEKKGVLWHWDTAKNTWNLWEDAKDSQVSQSKGRDEGPPWLPPVSTFSTSAARGGKTFAVFGRTQHRKGLSGRDKGSIEVGELQFWAKAQGRERKKKQGAFSTERDPCWGRVDWAKLWTRGSLNKACWSSSSPVGKRMLLSSRGEKTELLDRRVLINLFCL